MAKESFDVKKSYESWSTGKQTINDIADENDLTSLEVSQALESHIQTNKKAKKDK